MITTLTNSFDKPYLSLEWDQANGWIYNRWQGLLSTENVIKGCEQVLALMQQTKCVYLLNDNREVTGSWNQANDWIAQEWMPRALALDLRRFAHVLAPGVFGQTSAEQMLQQVKNRFQMVLFHDFTEAQRWLREAQRTILPTDPS
ncbi:hypothetical protein [Hymenobacter cellulosilyticus]|uniref:STAS/SEC14 domain-containing protein n=1 Tax=Hymenobacter cellulosilyticus TaxID=2932248 RepID=A0A8T9QBI0_9BACT|nr:hypothetical protein [Hymenobacter cellulosilyticus]UOQ74896.1 hypothetical protein MUN79_14125 [Hymenobacter cellulosilyticus]